MTFLIMYALMWFRGIQIGIQFFTVASCMLNYFEVSLFEFGIGIRDIAHYLSAERRMNVGLYERRFKRERLRFVI